MTRRPPRILALLALLLLGAAPPAIAGTGAGDRSGDPVPFDELDEFELDERTWHFDDRPLRRDLKHPGWWKLSFLDLPEDLREAVAAGKEGLMVYFGQEHCAYCEALLEVNFGLEDIVAYTRRHFDVVAIDIWGDRMVTDMQGRQLSEKAYAERERTNFTPSIIFYDAEGREALRLRGYYPPYRFRAALEYVADGHYQEESFRAYLARAEPNLAFSPEELIDEEFFARPPYILDRSRFPADRPLAVFFEQGNCHACDVLHTEQLRNLGIVRRLEDFETVQLDLWSDTPVITPAGERTTAGEWAERLGIFYAPTMVFFDERGREIFRVDSVVRFHRLSGVLDWIRTGAYREQPYYQRWREQRRHSGAPAEGQVTPGRAAPGASPG